MQNIESFHAFLRRDFRFVICDPLRQRRHSVVQDANRTRIYRLSDIKPDIPLGQVARFIAAPVEVVFMCPAAQVHSALKSLSKAAAISELLNALAMSSKNSQPYSTLQAVSPKFLRSRSRKACVIRLHEPSFTWK